MFSVQIICNFLQAAISLVSVQWTMFSKATPSQTEIQQVAPPSTNQTRLSLKPPPEPLVEVHPQLLHLFVLILQIQRTLNSYSNHRDSWIVLGRNLWSSTNLALIIEILEAVLFCAKLFTDSWGESQKCYFHSSCYCFYFTSLSWWISEGPINITL